MNRREPPACLEQLRRDLGAFLDATVIKHGTRHPRAQIIAGALMRGDSRSLRACWSMFSTSLTT